MPEEPEQLGHVLGRWSFFFWWGLILSRRACCLECFSSPFPEEEILDFLLVRTAEHARGIRLEVIVAKANIIPHTWRVLYSGMVKKVGKKDRQGQVGSLGDWLLQWKNSCLAGYQKPRLKVLMSGTCYTTT